VPGISNLSLLKSITRYLRLFPAPLNLVVIRPRLSRPPVLFLTLNKDFYVFTGSTVGVTPILGKGIYQGRIDKIGSVKAKII